MYLIAKLLFVVAALVCGAWFLGYPDFMIDHRHATNQPSNPDTRFFDLNIVWACQQSARYNSISHQLPF